MNGEQQLWIADQINRFFAQELWLVSEARRLIRRRASGSRTMALREVSVRAGHLVKEWDRFRERFELPA